MASLFDTTRNFSFYTIPAAWVIAFFPHPYAVSLSKSFSNISPRTYVNGLKDDQTIDQATKDRIIRAEGAQTNGFENLGLFATAVVAGNLAGLPSATLNTLSAGYLASRILYNYIYITNTTNAAANMRSAAFLSGIGMIFTLFIKSGNILRERTANLL
ncbi:uncharacterized protein RAG0_15416 [Rhynchosporium agropyri]|uniref:Uncharacterized protein n=3 Tax=Rhynchosporium TaxID=38037 RepID=A0A1E1MV50_RHYSE|nr:uncharacterized protein RAG0_15416 [Rhynchosporium agropyri]CZT12014.1 uncharacterized protein RCO7_10959 [Rhynchosporium commune]CZT52953.1 uncharacterized protein RSE6_14366 [Rhynchosporium secalis]